MMFARVLFGAANVGVRHVTQSIHPFEAAFFRTFFGLLVLAPSFITHGLRPLRTGRFRLHFARATLNAIAMLAFFLIHRYRVRGDTGMIPTSPSAPRNEESTT